MTNVIKMADDKSDAPYEVAYRLLATIASNEGKTLQADMTGKATADRKWLLDTYVDCVLAVARGVRP